MSKVEQAGAAVALSFVLGMLVAAAISKAKLDIAIQVFEAVEICEAKMPRDQSCKIIAVPLISKE